MSQSKTKFIPCEYRVLIFLMIMILLAVFKILIPKKRMTKKPLPIQNHLI